MLARPRFGVPGGGSKLDLQSEGPADPQIHRVMAYLNFGPVALPITIQRVLHNDLQHRQIILLSLVLVAAHMPQHAHAQCFAQPAMKPHAEPQELGAVHLVHVAVYRLGLLWV